ncbi:hypothetical protein DCAR_0415690 [Daucus carota subsp. sativus]|uniref:Uncharacterized protein n=1 Tax=Daucus carota subsp. sativus TaxID=79200 RepID=A0AAF0WYP2_DAUCS|nr:PREDICTED: (-)-germacrene D synthase-like [Daucus carota subsp. sativus]WOG96355.1 hypothetical protein DCAR_0415690 [Daucus carota subsp. sativus]
MSASAGSVPEQNAGVPQILRRSASYHPSVWGDFFLAYDTVDHRRTDRDTEEKAEELKEQVTKMLLAAAHEPRRQLKLINDIQRLGVAYHFEAEIEAALSEFYNIYHEVCGSQDGLFMVALCFRLLRQHGFNVPADVFNKFKDGLGIFNEDLSKDVEGLLSLYEAAHLRVHGEDILEEALAFTTSHLERLKTQLKNELQAKKVIYALETPVWWNMNRVEARRYISVYALEDSHNETLLNFAILDFNLLQKVYQGELVTITRWWRKINFTEKLPFARDRMVECYFWVLGLYFEPQHSLARKILNQIFAFMITLDDIYDVYGTVEELVIFTDAIERWDLSAADQLPEYMRYFYGVLLDTFTEIEEDLKKAGIPLYRVDYAKKVMKQLTRSYHYEAKCFYKGYVPTVEEYMDHALITAALIYFGTSSFVGITGDLVTKQSLDWISNNPLFIKAGSLICRLLDDMVEFEGEKETVDAASAVECYMKQHNASKECAFAEFNKQLVCAWKDINAEFFRPTVVPMPLLTISFNMTRVSYILYQNNDGFTTSETKTKEIMTPVLVHPIPISMPQLV